MYKVALDLFDSFGEELHILETDARIVVITVYTYFY